MPDVISRQLRVVLCAALLLPLWTQAQAEDWYKVELLVFSNLTGGAAESWDALPELSYPDATTYLSAPEQRGVDTLQGEQSPSGPASEQFPPVAVRSSRAPYLTLPTAQLEFGGAAARMKRSGRYRVLFHHSEFCRRSASRGLLLWPSNNKAR